jgi:flavodoxin I
MTKKIVMIYANMSGNTEEMATAIETGVKEAGAEIDVIDINDCSNVQVLEEYAGVLLGAYTWGMENFHMNLRTFTMIWMTWN